MCLVLVPVVLLAPVVLIALLVIVSAPAAVPYLLLTQPDDFRAFWIGWLFALPASPFVAYWLAGRRFTVNQRRRRDRRAEAALLNTPADERARKRRRLLQAAIILPITSVVGLVTLKSAISAETTISFAGFVALTLALPIVMLPLSGLFRLWDRRYPPLGESVSEEQVRQAVVEAAEHTRAEQEREEQARGILLRIEAQLNESPEGQDFPLLAEMQGYACAFEQEARAHYASVRSSFRALSVVALRGELMTRGRTSRLPGTDLPGGVKTLMDQVGTTLEMVDALSRRTEELRRYIRDH